MAGTTSPNSDFRLDVEHRGDAAVVKLAGSINMNVCDRLQSELLAIVDRPTPKLVLDLSRLEFICSLGLGALVAAHLRSRHHKGAVRLVSPDPSIRALLEITKLIKIFPPYESVEHALAEG
ncbi:MAG TPA: STAS domain-containing protein [Phycisphaerae bacterium]|nr:STAS domain-containing protein [Phycisphaerae bacterium]HOJ73403.1 STAS domain-containing protein [Phycisphaerae bacterium]HOM51012.1 STAS domain-containing protein [Phycisphaerae bacterium]HOQ87313.1 STAS domain-containing protein [Phycisphaerae bacterium]HPP25759.1 STAS domain-containing protein [Phycisphaerae bacterium]